MIFILLQKQIDKYISFPKENAEELQNKIDVFYLANRIKKDEYESLTEALKNKIK